MGHPNHPNTGRPMPPGQAPHPGQRPNVPPPGRAPPPGHPPPRDYDNRLPPSNHRPPSSRPMPPPGRAPPPGHPVSSRPPMPPPSDQISNHEGPQNELKDPSDPYADYRPPPMPANILQSNPDDTPEEFRPLTDKDAPKIAGEDDAAGLHKDLDEDLFGSMFFDKLSNNIKESDDINAINNQLSNQILSEIEVLYQQKKKEINRNKLKGRIMSVTRPLSKLEKEWANLRYDVDTKTRKLKELEDKIQKETDKIKDLIKQDTLEN
ncbi:hypothetical protein K9M79_08375 [Candidatus Woesearchaeota archaeon]|nr:hypothetical protein [Candidatus Woesearchaeota archaeon]